MRWRKLGLVYRPSGELAWARQYAHLPTPVQIDPDLIRIYYAGLNELQHGSIGYIDVAATDPLKILDVGIEPVLQPGEGGLFDDSGVNPSCVLRIGSAWRMYYIGWQRSQRTPYALLAGLAKSPDGGQFEKVSRVPILERSHAEPFLRSAPSVLEIDGGFRAWYVSATNWTTVNDKPYPRYVVRTAASPDGVQWPDSGPICIDLAEDEFGIGRPWVVRDADRCRMWYSIRSHSRPYRIGYAESTDGLQWTRFDEHVGIEASETSWDSEMICYAAIIDVNGHRLMFYNGNRHGESGFGVAVLEQD